MSLGPEHSLFPFLIGFSFGPAISARLYWSITSLDSAVFLFGQLGYLALFIWDRRHATAAHGTRNHAHIRMPVDVLLPGLALLSLCKQRWSCCADQDKTVWWSPIDQPLCGTTLG